MPSRAEVRGATADHFCWRLDRSGGFIMRGPDQGPLRLRGRKARAIVGYLALHAGQRVIRDRLIELLWSDRREAQARGSLRQCLFEIRQAAPGLISSDHEHAWMECNRVVLDGSQNTSCTYPLFEDLDDISPEFDEWLRLQRAEDADIECAALQRNVEDILSRGEGRKALPLIERMHRIDPYSEDWVRLAMRAEYQLGHPAGIVRCFTEFKECLRRDLGVLPATETRALHDGLLNKLTVRKPEPDLAGVRNIDLADPLLFDRLCGLG